MAERKARPATYALSSTLEQERDEQVEREQSIKRSVRPKASLSDKLAAEREALIAKEESLKGISTRKPPNFGR